MKCILMLVLLFFGQTATAFEYCSGKIKRLVTRDTYEGTEVSLLVSQNGQMVESGYARIGDENGYSDHEQVQISMLLAAYMGDKIVNLELVVKDGETFSSCSEFTRGVEVRNVNLRN